MRNRKGPNGFQDLDDSVVRDRSGKFSPGSWLFSVTLRHQLTEILVVVLLAGIVAVGFTALLYVLWAAWDLYQATAVGGRFLLTYRTPRIIEFLASQNIPVIAFWTTLIVLGMNLSVAVVSQFLELVSPLYSNCGRLVRFTLWGLPLTWGTALILRESGLIQDFQIAFLLTLPPTLCLLDRSFRFAFDNMPELGLLIADYPRLSRIWEAIQRSLLLLAVSTVLSGIFLYLLKSLSAYPIPFPLRAALYAESPFRGHIPFDLTTAGLVELAFVLSFTVFTVCLTAAVIGQIFHLVKGFYLPRSLAVKACGFGPIFVLFCGLGIQHFNQIEPLQTAIVLAIVPTFSMCGFIFRQISDFVPELGEIVPRLDPTIKHPLDMPDLFAWLRRKLQF